MLRPSDAFPSFRQRDTGQRRSRRRVRARQPACDPLEGRVLLAVAADFNGDGFADLAVRAPGEALGAGNRAVDAGAVNVFYGRSPLFLLTGATNNRFWTQESPGVAGDSDLGNRFGSALAAGDFDHDGFSDLAIGVPFKSGIDAGAENILHQTA